MSNRKIKRREFLKLSALAGMGAAAVACAPTPEVIEKIVKETVVVEKEVEKEVTKVVEVEKEVTKEVIKEVEKQVTVVVEAGAPEPPLLADQVSSGALPGVDERLPVSAFVVGGREAIGKYGGEVRMVHLDPNSYVGQYGWFAERMVHFSDLDFRTMYGNVFESWEVSPDGGTYTLHMRPGMKYSDGYPLTTEQIAFWWDDTMLNAEMTGSPGYIFEHGDEVMELEVLDDHSFKITFAAPFGTFPQYLTRSAQWHFVLPSQYLSGFHARYVEKAKLDAMVSEAGFDTWIQLYQNKRGGESVWGPADNSQEYPMLSGWTVTGVPEQGLVQMVRNPYYWKVDQQGNQLPYIDDIRVDMASTTENVSLKIIQGELDYVGTHDVSIARYPLYKENEQQGNYIVGDYVSTMIDRYALYPNLTLPEDPGLQEITRHPNFCKALSVAIDREEVNQSLFYGLARMGQNCPQPLSAYYKEKYATSWAQYDPDLANELLDEMGLEARGADGFRLRPGGEPLKFNIEHSGARVGVATHEVTEMAVTFWREVGLDANTKEIASNLYWERMTQGLIHCGVWHEASNTDMLLPIEMRHIPIHQGHNTSAPLWAQWWLSGRKEGQEPPAEFVELYDWYDEMQVVLDENERIVLGQKIFDWLADRPIAIGFVVECPNPLIFNEDMRNLPRPKSPMGWDTYEISTFHPEAFFFDR
jgi:peptide/nickel transport system substrate-binding protein